MWMEKLKPYERLSLRCDMMNIATKKTWETAGYYIGEDIVAFGDNEKSISGSGRSRGSGSSAGLDQSIDESYRTQDTCFNIHELCTLLLVAVFPFYRKSCYYNFWLGNRHDKTFNTSEISVTFGRVADSDTMIKKSHRLEELFLMTASHFDASDLIRKLSTTEWLTEYLNVLKSCPIMISVAEAVQIGSDSTEYPLIYTNDIYAKKVRKGHDFTSMLGDTIHEKTKAIFIAALRHSSDVSLAVPAVSKSGRDFTDMLAVKHVKHPADSKRYVLGVHCDVNHFGCLSTAEYIQYMEDLLAIIPLLLK